MSKHHPFPLIKLPENLEQTLYLIREELKSRRLFHLLHKVGLVDCDFQPHLDDLILRNLQLDGSDETFNRYTDIMERRCKKIGNGESATRQAIKVYSELKALRSEN